MRLAFLVFVGLLAAQGSAWAQAADQFSRLRDALRLRPDQATAWQTYQAGVTPVADEQSRQASARRMLPNLPTPRRFALMEAVMTEGAQAFHRREAATLAFYSQLTPAQQATFDKLTSPAAQQQQQQQ